MTDFEVFIKKNDLKKSAIAQYIGVSNGFITQIINGSRRLPHDKLLKIIANRDWDTSMFGESNMLTEQSVSTNSENTNQQSDDMNASVFLRALAEEQSLTREALAQNARLIGIIERLHGIGIDDVYARISPPLQNQDQNCLK